MLDWAWKVLTRVRVLDAYPGVPLATPCWEWCGAKLQNGYGQFRTIGSHRLTCDLFGRRIPDGMIGDHLCRNPICCNPDHIEPVTHAENMRRGWFNKKEFCLRGHARTPDNIYPSGGCKACTKKRASEWNQNNPKRRKEIQKKHATRIGARSLTTSGFTPSCSEERTS